MKNRVFAVLLAAVMLLTFMPAMAFADDSGTDLGSCRIAFDGDTEYDWSYFYTIDGNDKKLSEEQMNITLVNGNETVPADAYELKLKRTWFDPATNKEMSEDVSFPLGIADVNKEEGFTEYVAVAEAKSGSGYTGKCEAYFYIKDAYSLNWICATVSFDSYEEDGWRMHDRVWVDASDMSEPTVTDGNGRILTAGTDFTSSWYKRTGDIDEPSTPETEKDFDYYLDRKDSNKLGSYPEKAGGYFVDIDGQGKYYGTATIIVDVTGDDDSVDTDLSHYEVIATDRKDGEWTIFTDTTDNITLNAEVRWGDYVLPEDKYDLKIEMEYWDEDDNQKFDPVENGKIKLGEDNRATVIAYAVAKEGSGFTGQTFRETYFDFCYKYNISGCKVDFPGGKVRTDIITPMSELYSFTKGSVIEDPIVSVDGEILKAGTDYKISYVEGSINKVHVNNPDQGEFDVYWVIPKKGGAKYDSVPAKEGVYQCRIDGLGKYEGHYDQTNIQIVEAKPMKLTATTKTVKYSKVKKKAQTVAPLKVSYASGTVTYSGKGTDSKSKKALTINSKTGKVTVKKGTKKGTYKMKVTVKQSADPATVTKTISIKVK